MQMFSILNLQDDINILLQYVCEINNYYFTRNMISVCLMYDFLFWNGIGLYIKTKQNIGLHTKVILSPSQKGNIKLWIL